MKSKKFTSAPSLAKNLILQYAARKEKIAQLLRDSSFVEITENSRDSRDGE